MRMPSSNPRRKPSQSAAATDYADSEQKGPSASVALPGFPIVGIGASAGGLEAFSSMLKTLVPDLGMAFVLVPHLDPKHKSVLSQILSRVSPMPIVTIADGMRVEPNQVYVIPQNCDLTITDSVLRIRDRELTRPVLTTIDTFFRSLASDQGSRAIGVILSGTASDGTLGLMAIKGEGGITFAQDTHSAKYDGMPANAIAAGCVDFILPPEEIARELARIRQHPYVLGVNTPSLEAEEHERDAYLSQIFRLLRRTTKADFAEYKSPTIGRRIQRRMALHKIERLGEYVALLEREHKEVHALYQDLLINVTSFFRNPDAFETLKQRVYPDLLRSRSSSSPIRIWVPGCSTGEEAYSHAISLVEFLGEGRTEIPIQIFATDLSENAVQRARAAVYKQRIEEDVSAVRLRRFFQKVEGGYQISKAIRDLCVFSTQNIFSDPPFSRIDLVSCRNVMIYLGQPLQKRVIPIFHYALNPSGFLMIGNTEGLFGTGPDLFELVDKKQKIYRKKLVATPVTFGFSVVRKEDSAGSSEALPSATKATEALKPPLDVVREANRLLLARYAPPAVVVNEQLDILQSRGRTSNFLELGPGKASLNLLKMARPGLLFELQAAIDEARKSGVEAERSNVGVEGDGATHLTNLRVIPFRTPVQEQYSFLTIFEPVTPLTGSKRTHQQAAASQSPVEQIEREKQIGQLKQELSATKEYLQSIIETQESTNEELQSANEEIQSGNEELQSTNEELQTSKEELESANEELHTVNEEMQHRNELLTQLNNDLTNLLNSINLPMMMVGSDLSVRRFTPQAASMLGLDTSDIGRPIPRLKLKLSVRDLEQMMLEVVQEVQPRNLQVQDQDNRWFNLRITPYRTHDNRIDGTVVTVLDIDTSTQPAAEVRNKSGRISKNKKVDNRTSGATQ